MNDQSIIRNTAHVDFNDKNLDNVRFVEVNSLPAVRERLTLKFFTLTKLFIILLMNHLLLGLDLDVKIKLDEQDSIKNKSFLTSPRTMIDFPTKSCFDS